MNIFSRTLDKWEYRKNMYSAKISMFTVYNDSSVVIVVYDESISLSSSKSYMRGKIGYVTEVNLIVRKQQKYLFIGLFV